MTPIVDTLLVGISGPSSSGKTTLSRLLRDIWPNTLIVHEDDFYWSDAQIPVKDGIQDWDCLESLDLEKLERTLRYMKKYGQTPPDLNSKEDENSVGECNVDPDLIHKLKGEASAVTHQGKPLRIILVDGFLLYAESMQDIWKLFDVRLFLRTDYDTAKKRRENRSGYVTLEGFWEDPPGYVDKVVWPNYVKDHAFLFEGGDVESPCDEQVCAEIGLRPVPENARNDMSACLSWAFGEVRNSIMAVSRR